MIDRASMALAFAVVLAILRAALKEPKALQI